MRRSSISDEMRKNSNATVAPSVTGPITAQVQNLTQQPRAPEPQRRMSFQEEETAKSRFQKQTSLVEDVHIFT